MRKDRKPFSLYIHIPYCVSKCPYCDFNSHSVPVIPEERYTRSLTIELESYATTEDWADRTLKSIFFGGGTPSTFGPESIGRILQRAESLFGFERDTEITLEANPGTVDSKNFAGYRGCGVNRISIGAQSFQPRLLEFLGRRHTADETRQALRIVRQAGFDNFNLDLIYGTPGQTLAELRADLIEALSFHPPHLSAYNLTIEPGTPFHRAYTAGRMHPLPDETEMAMAELIEERLREEGLDRYEISNYARDGFQCRHNVNYWQGGDYLGIGAGAYSTGGEAENGFPTRRWGNEKNPTRYMQMVEGKGQAVVADERIDPRQAAGEFMFLGLRMTRGIPIDSFCRRFQRRPEEFYPRIRDWIKDELIGENDQRLYLTRRGLAVADSLFVDFV